MAKVDAVVNARLAAAAALSDAALLSQVCSLAARERAAIADLVAHLAEFDARKLYRGEGFSSLFVYCTSALRLSEQSAYNRIEAARAARSFPVVLDGLADGSLKLATLRLLAPHLTDENHEAVLDEAAGKSKREVELIVARLAPRPDVPSTIRRLPSDPPSDTAATRDDSLRLQATPFEERAESVASDAVAMVAVDVPRAVAMPSPKRPLLEPLSRERFRLQFTVGQESHDRLRRLQDLLRREIPDGNVAEIFERALVVLLAETERQKLAATARPRARRPLDPDSRHIPAEVKRAVWARDAGQCAFLAPNGRRCRERAFLEFHHCRPWASGGESSVENISLRCRIHNAWEAELYFDRASWAELAPGQVGADHFRSGSAFEHARREPSDIRE
jgi:hypothetical protein